MFQHNAQLACQMLSLRTLRLHQRHIAFRPQARWTLGGHPRGTSGTSTKMYLNMLIFIF